jgi:hypothetical protein
MGLKQRQVPKIADQERDCNKGNKLNEWDQAIIVNNNVDSYVQVRTQPRSVTCSNLQPLCGELLLGLCSEKVCGYEVFLFGR